MRKVPAPVLVLALVLGLVALLLALRLIAPSEFVPVAKFCAAIVSCSARGACA
jgi:hypothetical protein